MSVPTIQESSMQIESINQLAFNPDDFISMIKEILKDIQFIQKDEIAANVDKISTVIQKYVFLENQELEESLKKKLFQEFYQFIDEILEKVLYKVKIYEENLFINARSMVQKVVHLLTKNLNQDNYIIRKCLITLFNIDNKSNEFYSNNIDPPNRYFFSELIENLKERREWFESLKIGDLVDAVKIEENYRKQCWSHARVTDKTEARVKLSFLCDSNKYDRSVEWASYELRQYKTRCFDFEWRQSLKPDMVIDVCDTACVWYSSTILDTRSVVIEGIQEPIKELYIGYRVYCDDGDIKDSQGRNFNGWTSKYDEWIPAHSPRLQQQINFYFTNNFPQKYCNSKIFQLKIKREKKMAKKLFKQASQSNSEKIIDDSNDIIFDYEYNSQFKNIKAIHRVQSIFQNFNINSSFIQFINDFGEGFKKILDIILASNQAAIANKNTNQSSEQIISFQALCDYIQIIYYVSPFLLKQFCMEYIPQLNDAVRECIMNITENNIRQFKREQISEMIKNYGIILMRYFSIGQKIEILEELEYKIAKMCFESSFVKQKTIGMELLTQIVLKLQKNSKKSFQLNEIKQEIERNKYIDQLFNEDTHIQLLQKCTDLFIFLIEQNLFNEVNMKKLWSVIQKSHDDTRICYYNLLKQVTKSFKACHIQALYEEINLKEENKYKNYEIDILFEICFQEKCSFLEKYRLQNQIFIVIWDYINSFNEDINNTLDLEKSKMKQVVDKFCLLINQKKREKQVQELRDQLIQNIKEGRNTYFSLEILESVMSQLNGYLETQIKDYENLNKAYSTLNSQNIQNNEESQPQQPQIIQFVQQSQQANDQSSNSNQQTETNIIQHQNLVQITDLCMELENEINQEDNDIWQRFPNLRLPNQQLNQQTQQFEAPLSPSLQRQRRENREALLLQLKEKERSELRVQLSKKLIQKKEDERKEKCLEIKKIVINNLKILKGKYNQQELENSPQLTKSYICQIEKRINFLSFINDDCQIQILDYELISLLLKELIENQLVRAESEFFYRWLKKSNKMNRGVIPYIRQFFLDKLIKDDHFISTLSLEGFDCFKSLFIEINLSIGNITTISDQQQLKSMSSNQFYENQNTYEDFDLIFGEYRVDFLYQLNKNPEKLEGLLFLWKITFIAQNEQVFDAGAKFLVNLYLRTTENLEDQVQEIRNQFFKVCFKNIVEKKYLVRTIQLIHYFLDFSELKGIGSLIPHSSESFTEKNTLLIKNQLTESENILKIQSQFQLPCSFKTTLHQLRVNLSQIFKINVDEILLLVPGKNQSYGTNIPLKDFLNGYTLQGLEFSQTQTIIVQKQQKKYSHPIKLIRNDETLTKKAQELFKEWFKAYSENGRMSMQNCAHFIESCTKDVCKVDDYRVIDVFKFWDSDKDGYLSEHDFLEFYRKGSKDKRETVMRNIQAHYYSDDLARLYEINTTISKEEVQELPRYLLSQNEQFQREIFQLYDLKDDTQINTQKMRFLIEKLFSRLPTCGYIQSIIQNTEKVSEIFEKASNYEFFYILECIENKFFENSLEKEKGSIEIEEIMNKFQCFQNQSSSQLTGNNQQSKALETQNSNNQQQQIQSEQQTNQKVHQMSNENKEINLVFENFDKIQQIIQQNNTEKNSTNEFMVNFFSKGIFEKLLSRFQILIQNWNYTQLNLQNNNNNIQQNLQEELSLNQIKIKLFQRFFKIFSKFLSANLIQEYPYIFYLKQYLSTIFITLEEIDEDLSNRQNPQTDMIEEIENIEQENHKEQFIGPLIPKNQKIKQVSLQEPQIDKLQEIFIQFIQYNTNIHDQFLKFQNINITETLINTILSTLRQVNKFTNTYRTFVIDSLFTLLLLLYKNQELFVQQFFSYPESILLMKEGLFYSKNKLIRQIFSFFIFLVLRQLNEKKHLIKTLISLIPQNNSSDQMAETCTQFFSLLCLIFNKYQEKISSDGFDFDTAFGQVFETLKNIQSKENLLGTSKDNFLSGYMQLTDVILKNSANISKNTEKEYLKYLINHCLFDSVMTIDNQIDDLQTSTQSNIQQIFTQIQNIKCLHTESRVQCFKQILSLCKQYTEDFPSFVLESIAQIVQKVKRTQKQKLVNYDNNIKGSLGYVGLKNLGATCYINSMIQQIFTCNPLVYSILAADDQQGQNFVSNSQGTQHDDNILHQIQKLFAFLHLSVRKDFNTDGFCFSLKGYDGERTQTNLQQDTQEFLNLLVERIHSSLENTAFRGIFDTFYGVTTVTERTCKKCLRKTQTEQPFYMIPIKITGEKTLQGSLEKTFRSESIQDYRCDECKQVSEAQSQEYIKNLPNTLILNLFRISHNFENGLNQKDNSKITFEQNLNMHQFMYNSTDQMEIENMDTEDYEYTLKGIVIHNGTANFGHYFSYIKISENKWLEFNDSVISEYNPKDIPNDCFGVDSQEQKIPKPYFEFQKSAYLLFYEKVKKNHLEFKIKNQREEEEIITKLGLKNPTTFSNWRYKHKQEDVEYHSNDNQKEKQSYTLRADYYDVNQYISETQKNQAALDNYQFICEKLLLQNQFLSFINEIILQVPIPSFYQNLLQNKPLKSYMPIDLQKLPEDILLELKNFNEKYNYSKIFQLIAYIYFNFIPQMQESQVTDSWFELFYRFSSLCPETALDIFQKNIAEKMDFFWQDILQNTNPKQRSTHKQIVIHLLIVITKSFNINVFQHQQIQTQPDNQNPSDIVVQFLINLFQGLHTQIANSFYRCEQYFDLLRDLADSDILSAAFMIKFDMIEKLLDFYLAEDSQIINKYFKVKKANHITGNTAHTQFNPLLTTVYNLLCKKKLISLQIQKDPTQFSKDLVSDSKDFEKMINEENLYKRALKMKSDPNIIGRIISHMSYKNYQYSYFIAQFIIKGINEKFISDDIYYYLEIMSNFITILDEYKVYRLEWILGIPQLKKNLIYSDFSLQQFLDQNYYQYISTINPDGNQNEQTKGFLSRILDCNIGYASEREHHIVNKLLQLVDINDQIFNYILTIQPYNYELGYFIEFIGPYIKKNQQNQKLDLKSTAVLSQIELTYQSILQKIQHEEEQFQKIYNDLQFFNKQYQSNNLNQKQIQIERQRIFETYIYGSTISTKQIQILENISNYSDIICYTNEYDVYYCQNKISAEGKNIIFPEEINKDDRIEINKINLDSNIFLLFNEKIKQHYLLVEERQIETQNQNIIEEEEAKQETESANNSVRAKFSSLSSLESSKIQEKIVGSQEQNQNPESNLDNTNQIQGANQKMEEEGSKIPIQNFESQTSLTDTEINQSTNQLELVSKDITNKESYEFEQKSKILANISGLNRDKMVREVILENKSKITTYKVILQIQPKNQFSNILSLSNFKYPSMVERIILPSTSVNLLILTKSIPCHSWGDYDLNFKVEILSQIELPQNVESNHNYQQIIGCSPFPPNCQFNLLSDADKAKSQLDSQVVPFTPIDLYQDNFIICKYCTLKNSSTYTICEACYNPLQENPSPPSA